MTTTHIQGYLNIAVEFAKVVVWPIFGLVILRQFRGVIVNALNRSKSINLKFAGVEIEVSEEEVANALSGILDEILTELLTLDEKQLLLRVLACPASPTVETIFPGFDRETDKAQLKMLRALRGVAFIRPLEGGTWGPKSHIEVTDSGKLVARYRRDVLQGNTVASANNPVV